MILRGPIRRAWSGCVRIATGIATGIAISAASVPVASACQSCFGAEDSPLVHGARWGAFALVAVTLGVQGGFVAFFIHLKRRARIVAAMEASSPWAEDTDDSR